MYIYKITNIINNKVYIGQTCGSIEKRWKRHQNDALSNRLDTHFARAIRKYGVESFIVEQIDSASSQDELNQKEHDWIAYFDSIRTGYNETSAISKCGGNTYLNKTPQELKQIGEKIRQTKCGNKNPQSRRVKCKNILTGEELHFGSMSEMQIYFNADNHQFISRRCLGRIKSLYLKQWAIAYEEDDYNPQYTSYKHHNRAKQIIVEDLETGFIKTFHSYAEAERFFNQKPRSFSSKAYKRDISFIYKERYKITKVLK